MMIDHATPQQPSLDQGQPTQQRRLSRRRRRRSKARGKRRKKSAAIYSRQEPIVDRFRAQHLVLAQRQSSLMTAARTLSLMKQKVH